MLRLNEIDKSFGATRALTGVTIEAAPGTVLGLVGENGAGKSTLMKVAGGTLLADRGTVSLAGQSMQARTTHEAQRHGIVSVFQELTLLRDLTIEQNLFLIDAPRTFWGSIDRSRVRRRTTELLAQYALPVAPDARVADLPLGQQQMLEIVRAVARKPRVLLLDEATSALGATEVEWLRELVSRLKANGTITLFISHRWDEVVSFCDRVAVLRNGELVGVADTGDLNEAEAIRLMTGRASAGEAFPAKPVPQAATILRATDLRSPILDDVSLDLKAGEILGLGGLVGQGQGHLLEALFGAHRVDAGTILLNGTELHRLTPRAAMRVGIAYVPQERKTQGLLLGKSVGHNLTLATLDRLKTLLGLIDPGAERDITGAAIAREKIRTRGAHEPIRNLSGGNQQKVLLERWLMTKPAILLLNDVTRGVDIGTKRHIYDVIAGIARDGVGIIWYSTDARELVGVAHRVLVILAGRIAAELTGADVTADRIVEAAVLGGDAR